MKSRQTKLIVDIEAMIKNYKTIQTLQPNKKILPVLKANGYGLGLEAIRAFIDKTKIDMVGLAIVDEGIIFREELGYKDEIVILNQPTIEDIQSIVKYNITVGCCYIEFLEELNRVAKENDKISKIHIEIETGMGRTGVQLKDLKSFIERATELKNIEIEGIYTHFSTSDIDLVYTGKQIQIFEEAIDYIKSKVQTVKYIHCGNSGAIIQLKNLPGNMIRPGIILYGYIPDEELKGKVDLYPTCVLKSKVSYIKTVDEGTSISYGRTFITQHKSIIANIPIGYADGIRRGLSNSGSVVINGRKAPIVGRICMDSFMIDVTEIPEVKIGDDVYIWDNKIITLEDIAKQCGTINYEILSTISDRVIRNLSSVNREVSL